MTVSSYKYGDDAIMTVTYENSSI